MSQVTSSIIRYLDSCIESTLKAFSTTVPNIYSEKFTDTLWIGYTFAIHEGKSMSFTVMAARNGNMVFYSISAQVKGESEPINLSSGSFEVASATKQFPGG